MKNSFWFSGFDTLNVNRWIFFEGFWTVTRRGRTQDLWGCPLDQTGIWERTEKDFKPSITSVMVFVACFVYVNHFCKILSVLLLSDRSDVSGSNLWVEDQNLQIWGQCRVRVVSDLRHVCVTADHPRRERAVRGWRFSPSSFTWLDLISCQLLAAAAGGSCFICLAADEFKQETKCKTTHTCCSFGSTRIRGEITDSSE